MPIFDTEGPSLTHAGKTIALDHGKGEVCFSSHAHSDHSTFLHKARLLYASEETISLWQARSGKTFNGELLSQGNGVKLFNAGHVLGARQIFVEGDGGSFCYTGDFCATATATCQAAIPVECDELVVECTFGIPRYTFPKREEIERQIGSWVQSCLDKQENVVLGGYSLGKAQELIKIVNDYCATAPLANEAISQVSKIYSRSGCFLDFVEIGTGQAQRLVKKPFVAILPMHTVNYRLAGNLSEYYGRKTRTAVATGWALDGNKWGVDKAFPLSDHSDFPSLMEFVLATGAKKVYCTHGFEREFASALQKKGIDASPLNKHDEPAKGELKQKLVKTLAEYTK